MKTMIRVLDVRLANALKVAVGSLAEVDERFARTLASRGQAEVVLQEPLATFNPKSGWPESKPIADGPPQDKMIKEGMPNVVRKKKTFFG